jgi:DNA-binding SARP family transcriptional activator
VSLSTVRCRILGQSEIHTRGIRLTPESELQFGLALYFCVQAGREVPRDEIARLFWPTHNAEAGRHCLRQAIYRLRVLGIAVRSSAKASVLDTHFIDADYAPAAVDGASASAYLRLEDVAVLPGYAPRFSRVFARWVEDFRDELGARMRRGLVRAISEMRARGRYVEVERLCRFCLRLDPLNEEATLALAESVALAGGKAEAVGLIDRYEGEVGRYRADLRVSASLLRERISDRLIRRNQAAIDLPMVGRESDVERVLTAFQRLRGNRAVSYVVTGVAGVGKTRLASECCRMAELQGARLLTISTQPSSRTQALFAVSELVDGLLEMPGAIGCAPAALECLRAMSSPVPSRESSLSMDVDGEARFAMVRWSILDVLDAILAEGPLVIHVDDAHQLDEQSQAILHDALRTQANRPLLLLFTMRPPEHSDAERFARFAGASTLHDLLPLSDASCELLVSRFCAAHEDSLDQAIRDRIIELSGGNPFFLVELLKHRSELLSDELPLTVQALLEDRLSRLSPAALTVLRAAAVLGLSSTVERLHRMVERKTSDVLNALTELHSAGMLSPKDGGAVCRHDTIREAVLERTPTAARVLLHRRAARTIGREALRDGGVNLLWESVHHWRSAGAATSGVRLALQLARRLLSLGLARDGMLVLQDIEQTLVDSGYRAVTLRLQARAARMLRDWPTVEKVIGMWRDCFLSEGRLPPAHCGMELLGFEAQYNGYATFGHMPIEIETCVTSLHASVAHRLMAAALSMIKADNEFDALAASRIYDAVKHLRPGSKRERIAWLTTQAVYHTSFGELQQAPSILRQLASEALSLAHPASRAFHVRRASFGLARYDNPEYAGDLLLQCLEIFDRLDLRTQALFCIEELGSIALWRGNTSEVLNWAERIRSAQNYSDVILARAIEYELRMLVAFETENPALMPSFPLSQDFSAALSRSKRGKQTLLTLALAEHLLRRDLPAVERSLKPLLDLFVETKTRGNQDQAAAIITNAMISLGRSHEAALLMSDYMLSARRELRAPSQHLQTLFDRFSPTQRQPSTVSMEETTPAAPNGV